MNTISESQVFLDGLHYKIGHLGRPYIFLNDDWIRSTKSAEEVKRAIERERDRVAV